MRRGGRGKGRWPGCCGSCGWPGTSCRCRRRSARRSCFPGATLEFSNDFGLLESEIGRHFPRQQDNFRRLLAALTDYDQFGQPEAARSAREVVGGLIDDPLLVEMLFCPVLFYGGAREHDMDFGQFSIMFRSIFLEGLARPLTGVRLILKRLVGKFSELGGELRLRSRRARESP